MENQHRLWGNGSVRRRWLSHIIKFSPRDGTVLHGNCDLERVSCAAAIRLLPKPCSLLHTKDLCVQRQGRVVNSSLGQRPRVFDVFLIER
jgi:hypothetical protein